LKFFHNLSIENLQTSAAYLLSQMSHDEDPSKQCNFQRR